MHKVRGPDSQGWFTALCPFHNDQRRPNLRLNEHGFRCMACDESGGLSLLAQKLGMAPPVENGLAFADRIVTAYDYRDEDGKLLYQAVRLRSPKDFRQRRPDGNGGWVWKLDGTRRVLYRLPELLAADPNAVVFVVEGEKDVDRLRSLGLIATTNPEGAGKWRDEFSEFFRGRKVVMPPDNDEPGRMHVDQVARSVHGVASEVRLLELPALPEKGDVSDWLDAGGTADALLQLASDAPTWERRDNEQARTAPTAVHASQELQLEWFFPKGFAARRLAERLREETFFACGGAQLHVYRGGVYRPHGDEHVRTRTAEILGDRWTRRRAEEVIAFLLATSPPLNERPPLDTVNVLNGLLDVDRGTLRGHNPDFLSPVQLGCSFKPTASCAKIDRFVDEVFPHDARDLAYELAGHLMIPDTTFERAVMLLGGGSNGKSTFLGLIEAFLGPNVSAVTLQALDSNRFAAARLYGKLANVVADLDAEAVKSSAAFKAIVSGDAIEAERKYAAPFSFRPYARLLFSANEPPPTHDTSFAYFRRWIIAPFDATFTGDNKDRNLREKLTTQAELSGLLNRALEGLARIRRNGDFTSSRSLIDAAREFRTAVDSAAAFVDEESVLRAGCRIRQSDLYAAYKTWCEQVTRSPLSARRFNQRVTSLLPDPTAPKIRRDGYDYWQGITLTRLDSRVVIGACEQCQKESYLRNAICKTCEETGQKGQ